MRLIKTAIDRCHADDSQHDVLLGDWCLKDEEDVLGSKNKYNKIPYHWNNREKFSRDYIYLDQLYERTLTQLGLELNKLHSVDQNLRYWRILIGPWLRFLVDALFDRYECVREAKAIGTVTSFNLFSYSLDDWCPADFSEFWDHFTSDEWNEVIFSECLLDQGIAYTYSDKCIVPLYLKINENFNFSTIVKNRLKSAISIYSKAIRHRQTGSVIIGAYVPINRLIRLQLRLGQIPYISIPEISLKYSAKSVNIRDNLCRKSILSEGFDGFLAKLIRLLMPKVYLEDFSTLRTMVMNALPSNPQSIFTANAYHANDVFKIWAAEKVSQGVPLIIGQHGGTFGMSFLNQSEDHQLRIANKFVSWGWESKVRNNVIGLPSFQLSGRTPIIACPNGKILHVLSSLPRYFYQHFSMPIAGQFLDYINNQINFLNELETGFLDNVCIRLDSSGESRGWNIPKALDLAGYSQYIDKSNDRIPSLLGKSRLCVCTHNATVFLECLAMNFPTIIFWESSHHEIRPDAVTFFDLLVEAEVLFYTPHEAAKKVNSVAGNVDEWWYSEKVQSARLEFCERFAQTSSDWLDEWSSFLLSK